VATVVTNITKARIRMVSSHEEAVYFLQTVDQTLPPLPDLHPVSEPFVTFE
jgi:hypothetical protein